MIGIRGSVALAGICGVLAGAAACSEDPAIPGTRSSVAPAAQSSSQLPVARTRSPFTHISDDLPELPPGIVSAVRAPEITKAVYEFAARQPEVLKYIPCFCGCEQGGHRGNHDCFVAKRNPNGQVTEWDSHGIGCEVCIDVGQMAMQMHNGGASVSAIRDAVDRRYADRHYHTPTPKPPHKAGASH